MKTKRVKEFNGEKINYLGTKLEVIPIIHLFPLTKKSIAINPTPKIFISLPKP
jgi:hypothetical protein